MQKFIDPSTIRKGAIVKEKLSFIGKFPLFSIVEFNLFTNCTRTCSFCPVSNPNFYSRRNQKMDFLLYAKIIDDLAEIKYAGKILYSGFSEPLMHSEIADFISYTKNKLPLCSVEIVSNGDLVSEKKLRTLFSSGLDTISISMYDGAHQIDIFTSIASALSLNSEQVILRRRYFESGDYGLTITNRGGLVDSNKYRAENENMIISLPLKEACFYPFYMTKVDYNGDVLLCSHDWSKKLILGNLAKDKLYDIWMGDTIEEIRRQLSCKYRGFTPCIGCDATGTIIGKDSLKAWQVNANNG